MIVYGHRGARGEAPENTLAGCQHAVARDVRFFEIDLRLSKDHELVVIHDDNLLRTTGKRGKVINCNTAEMSKLAATASGTPWRGKRFTGVPNWTTLYNKLPEVKHWQLELKSGSKPYNRLLVEKVVQWLEQPRRNCTVTSFEPELLKQIKQALPKQSVGLVTEQRPAWKTASRLDANYLISHWKVLNRALVEKAQQQGMHVSSWTVNDASAIEALYNMGVDSVITDFPSMALPLVASLERVGPA